jgi:hypothetical protein
MNTYPEQRINRDLNAPNVIELSVDHSAVAQSYEEVKDILGVGFFDGIRISGSTGIGLYSLSSDWNGDLRWVSSGNLKGFAFFEKHFGNLKVEEKTKIVLGDCGDLIMYSGFFVIRSQMAAPHYHHDYSIGVGMNALTLMTPVSPIGAQGHLLYEDLDGEERVYEYSPGMAISFGGDFHHSTQPFHTDAPYCFLCFTYGVRDSEQWDLISETVTEQGIIYRHPELGIVETDE